MINPRNPFKKDEAVIDYDMDSEEEFEEENGEDINSDKEDDEDDLIDEEDNEGFIVPDGYLSQSEKGEGDEEDAKGESYGQMKRTRQINTIMQPTVCIFSQETKESMEQFKIFEAKPYISFPLQISAKDFDDKSDEDDKKDRMDPNAINNKIKEFVEMVHGSYEAKFKLIEDFAQAHPECSKASVERKLREIASKEKEHSQGKFRYLVKPE